MGNLFSIICYSIALLQMYSQLYYYKNLYSIKILSADPGFINIIRLPDASKELFDANDKSPIEVTSVDSEII